MVPMGTLIFVCLITGWKKICPSETFSRLLKEGHPRPNSFFPLSSTAPADATDPVIHKVSAKDLGCVLFSPSFLSPRFHRPEPGALTRVPKAASLTLPCEEPHQKLATGQYLSPNDAELGRAPGEHGWHH